jgi:hypothetical protein
MSMDDTLIEKLVMAEHDALRDVTGQPENTVPTYRPVAFTMAGNVD